jgi:oxalate decarboxylase/phosphoglucose isomerase-like protein (cupin superfamily)
MLITDFFMHGNERSKLGRHLVINMGKGPLVIINYWSTMPTPDDYVMHGTHAFITPTYEK